MYKKLGFYMVLMSFMMIGCQGESSYMQADSTNVEKCFNSGGEYDFTINNCICDGSKCSIGSYCIDNNPNENEVNLVCAECKIGDTKCDGDKLLSCVDKKWDIKNSEFCDFGCDSNHGICFECNPEGESNPVCHYKPSDENCKTNNDITENQDDDTTSQDDDTILQKLKNGNIYQCIDGYYVEKQNCESNGCSDFGDGSVKCNECTVCQQKCIEDENDNAVILKCKDGFWPKKEDEDWKDQHEIHENRFCHPEKSEAVECISNRCVDLTKDNAESFRCETYRDIILGYLYMLETLKYEEFRQKFNEYFEFEAKSKCSEMDSARDHITCITKNMCKGDNGRLGISVHEKISVVLECKDYSFSGASPCLVPEYSEPENSAPPYKYNVQFFPKACADPLEGSKYSNACAINDKD